MYKLYPRPKFSLTILLAFVIVLNSTCFSQKRTAAEEPYIDGQLIVQLVEEQDINALIKDLPEQYEFSINRELSKIMRVWLINFNPESIDQMQAHAIVNHHPKVSIVQNNHRVEIRGVSPNDPEYSTQWHHNNTGQGGGTVGADIQSEEAWATTTGGKNALGDDIVVCILEQVDFSHGDLINNHWVNTEEIPDNGIDDDGNGYIDDINGWNVGTNTGELPTNNSGHGTMVAGMIGAEGNNSLGIAGINWDVKMMNVVGYSLNSEASVIAAYEYPLVQRKIYNETNGQNGSFVVSTNASWGIDGGNPDNVPLWCAYYDTLGKYGILNCGATTNQDLNVDEEGDIPTACASKYMVGVGRSDRNDNFQGGYGLTTINFAAPGVNVVTTANGDTYTTTTGTSFSSPLTAGVIALMYSIPCSNFMSLAINAPQVAADHVFDALMDGTDPKSSLEDYFITGGRLNAKNSIDLLMDNVCSDCDVPSELTVTAIDDHTVDFSFDNVESASEYYVYFRETGAADYFLIKTNQTSVTLDKLNQCSSYEVYVQTNCSGELSGESPVKTFNTSGCGFCLSEDYCGSIASNKEVGVYLFSPDELSNVITDFIPTDGWGQPIADGYAAGDLVLVDDGTTSSQLGCNELINGNQVEGNVAVAVRGSCSFSLKAYHAQNAGATGLIIVNDQTGSMSTLSAGDQAGSVSIPVVMISQEDGTDLLNHLQSGGLATGLMGLQKEWIESITIDDVTMETGNNQGYLPPSTDGFQLQQGNAYDLTVSPGYAGAPLDQLSRVWIDFNQDGVFSSDERVFDQGTPSKENATGTIEVPIDALKGTTRMRVQMAYQGPMSNFPPSVCTDFENGEVEDYCVEITDGEDCGITISTTIEHPSCNTVADGSIDLDVTGPNPDYTFNWSNGSTTSFVNELRQGNYKVVITDTEGCDSTVNFTLNETSDYTITATISQPFCKGVDDGSIALDSEGFNAPTISWESGENDPFIENLASGHYLVEVTDDNGCFMIESFQLTNTNDINILLDELENPTCEDTLNGGIYVSATGGGGGTYSYSWIDGPESPTWENITNGEYKVHVDNSEGCNNNRTFFVDAVSTSPVIDFRAETNYLEVHLTNNSENFNYIKWDFGDGNSSTIENPIHEYQENGTYTVCLTIWGDCIVVDICEEVTVDETIAQVASLSKSDIFKMFPNPTREQFTLQVNSSEILEVELIDLSGKTLEKQAVSKGDNTINVNHLSPGVYMVKVSDSNHHLKFIDKISIQP